MISDRSENIMGVRVGVLRGIDGDVVDVYLEWDGSYNGGLVL